MTTPMTSPNNALLLTAASLGPLSEVLCLSGLSSVGELGRWPFRRSDELALHCQVLRSRAIRSPGASPAPDSVVDAAPFLSSRQRSHCQMDSAFCLSHTHELPNKGAAGKPPGSPLFLR